MGELAAWLEATTLARELRGSMWVYPLVNAAHVLGIGLLLGAIVPLDLRLLGAWSSQPLPPLWRVLSTMAAAGMAIGVASGSLLFVARATEYLRSPFFIAKMLVVALGCLNAIAMRRLARRGCWAHSDGVPPTGARRFAAVSLGAWTVTLVLGRLIGYF